jgi:hypothetical protein
MKTLLKLRVSWRTSKVQSLHVTCKVRGKLKETAVTIYKFKIFIKIIKIIKINFKIQNSFNVHFMPPYGLSDGSNSVNSTLNTIALKTF